MYFVILLFKKYYGDKITEDKIGRPYNTYGTDKRFVQNFVRKMRKDETT
jgi:hypothetical protein